MEHLLGRQQRAVTPALFAPIIGKPARASQRAACTFAHIWLVALRARDQERGAAARCANACRSRRMLRSFK